MISEQDKQKILNGAYVISRDGTKCKYVGLSQYENFPYIFIYLNKEGLIINTAHLTKEFNASNLSETIHDIVGLWEDKIEPFDLERALAGEPVMTREGDKAYIKYCLPEKYKNNFPIGGYIINSKDITSTHHYRWSLEGKAVEIECKHPQDIIGMWKDPELVSNTVTLTLPCPLKIPQDKMWILVAEGYTQSSYGKNISSEVFHKRPYFSSEADAKAWFDAMQTNRR